MENDSRSSLLQTDHIYATPSASHCLQSTRITELQKQALIDNLQLEGDVYPSPLIIQHDIEIRDSDRTSAKASGTVCLTSTKSANAH